MSSAQVPRCGKESGKVKVKSLSCVQLFETLWTVAYQVPQSMGFSRQGYWNGVSKESDMTLFLFQKICQTQGLNPGLLHCRQMLYHLSYQGSPLRYDLNQAPYYYTVEVTNRLKRLDLIDRCLKNYG